MVRGLIEIERIQRIENREKKKLRDIFVNVAVLPNILFNNNPLFIIFSYLFYVHPDGYALLHMSKRNV